MDVYGDKIEKSEENRHVQVQTIVYKYKSNEELLVTHYITMVNYTNMTKYINSKLTNVINN